MIKLLYRSRSLSTMLTLACTALAVQSNAAVEAVPGEFLVKLKPEYAISELRASIKSTIPSYHIVVVTRPSFESMAQAMEVLKSNEMVERVEPNIIYRIVKTPNDELFPQLWGMQNTGQVGIDIGATKAWDLETGSKDVIVAVIDTGVNYNHPELKDNMWVNEKELNGLAGVDDDNNGYIDDVHGYNFSENTADPMDDHGHGSHCSGTIGGKGNNGAGVVGVNWNVRIMPVKFLSKEGSGTLENAVKAIDYAVKNGAKILSNSWGGGSFTQTLMDVITDSNKAGALFVAAAGNNASNNDTSPSYPASYDVPNVVSIAAIDNRGVLASFSNYGKKSVHVGAPGVNILSITMAGYESWSGTSMATPHVSGIAALLAAHEPKLTNLELKSRIIGTAVKIPGLRNKVSSGGLANAYNALMNITPPPDLNDPALWTQKAVVISTPHPYAANANLTYEVSVPDAKEIALYFSKFDVENSYDFVELYNSAGKLITKYSGVMDDSYTDVISGNYVKIVLKADNIVQKNGFDLTKVAWR